MIVRGDWQWGNNDGLDVESGTNLTFSNSYFSTGDDCLAFRSGVFSTVQHCARTAAAATAADCQSAGCQIR